MDFSVGASFRVSVALIRMQKGRLRIRRRRRSGPRGRGRETEAREGGGRGGQTTDLSSLLSEAPASLSFSFSGFLRSRDAWAPITDPEWTSTTDPGNTRAGTGRKESGWEKHKESKSRSDTNDWATSAPSAALLCVGLLSVRGPRKARTACACLAPQAPTTRTARAAAARTPTVGQALRRSGRQRYRATARARPASWAAPLPPPSTVPAAL